MVKGGRMESMLNKRILQNIFRFYFTRHTYVKFPLKDLNAQAIMHT